MAFNYSISGNVAEDPDNRSRAREVEKELAGKLAEITDYFIDHDEINVTAASYSASDGESTDMQDGGKRQALKENAGGTKQQAAGSRSAASRQ